jgi:hypothetical protein
MEREAISKRLRFEIFKRDGFTCVYCGSPPTGGVLHLDHVIPVSEGGLSSADNLVTACPSCNLGKSDVPLERQVLPQFDPEVAREHAEQLKAWLAAQRVITKAQKDVHQELVNYWCESMGTERCARNVPQRLSKLTTEFPLPRIVEALQIVGAKRGLYNDSARLRYMYGILRVWRHKAKEQAESEPIPPPKDLEN